MMRINLLAFLALAACGSNSTDGGTPVGGDVVGCDGAKLLAAPSDPAAAGPWAVGARTVTIAGLTVEIWYPAVPGSDAGKDRVRYDLRAELPASEAAKIPDADNPWQSCDCVRDLPFDDTHGPYPIVLFVHGTAGFRHQSLPFMTHWASRGFVVVAADHPGLKLGDMLGMACGSSPPSQNLSANLDSMIAALAAPSGDLAFLAGHVDATRIAVAGHSAGGSAAADAATKAGVRVAISLAGNKATAASAALSATLYMGGLADNVVSFGQVKTAYDGAAKPRQLVGIDAGGHLTFSDLCQTKNTAGQDLLAIAKAHQVCGAQLAGFLFDCDPSHIDGATGWNIVNYATSTVLEQTLQCQSARSLASIKTAYPAVTQYAEDL